MPNIFSPKNQGCVVFFAFFHTPKTPWGVIFFEGVDFQPPPPRSHELDPRHGFGALRFDDFYAVFLLDTSIIGGFKPNGQMVSPKILGMVHFSGKNMKKSKQIQESRDG